MSYNQGSKAGPSYSQSNNQQGMSPTPYQSTIAMQPSNFGQPNPVQPNPPQNTALNSTMLQNYMNQAGQGFGSGLQGNLTNQPSGKFGQGGGVGGPPGNNQIQSTALVGGTGDQFYAQTMSDGMVSAQPNPMSPAQTMPQTTGSQVYMMTPQDYLRQQMYQSQSGALGQPRGQVTGPGNMGISL